MRQVAAKATDLIVKDTAASQPKVQSQAKGQTDHRVVPRMVVAGSKVRRFIGADGARV